MFGLQLTPNAIVLLALILLVHLANRKYGKRSEKFANVRGEAAPIGDVDAIPGKPDVEACARTTSLLGGLRGVMTGACANRNEGDGQLKDGRSLINKRIKCHDHDERLITMSNDQAAQCKDLKDRAEVIKAAAEPTPIRDGLDDFFTGVSFAAKDE